MRLRLATFNLRDLGGEPEDAARAEGLRAALARLDADVLCLQEIAGEKTGPHRRALAALARLFASTPYADFTVAGSHHEGEPGHALDVHNVAVASRWPMTVGQVWHGRVPPLRYVPVAAAAPEQAVRFERPILQAAVALPGGRTVHVLNAHLRASLAAALPGAKDAAQNWASVGAWAEGFFVSALKRAAQALELRLAVDALFDAEPEALVAVAGDLNAAGAEVPHRMLAAGGEEPGLAAFSARALTPLARALPDEARFSARLGVQPILLDHILVSQALLARFRSIAVDHEAWAVSDHAPLVAEFDVPD